MPDGADSVKDYHLACAFFPKLSPGHVQSCSAVASRGFLTGQTPVSDFAHIPGQKHKSTLSYVFPGLELDQAVLTGAVYLLSGAILQVLGKIHLSWLVRHRKNVPNDSGSDVRIHELASHQHIDILSFLLIAAGSIDLILSELGTVENSPTVLLISIPAIVATVGTGFSTYQMTSSSGWKSIFGGLRILAFLLLALLGTAIPAIVTMVSIGAVDPVLLTSVLLVLVLWVYLRWGVEISAH